MAPLTVADVQSLRAGSAPLPTTTGASVSADAFKSSHARRKPSARSLAHHFSFESAGFLGSAMKKSASLASNRKIIPLGTGRPTPDFYPWNSLIFKAMQPTLQRPAAQDSPEALLMKTASKQGADYNLSLALNYGSAAGSPHLLRFITEHMEIVHDPPYADWGVCLTTGATSALEMAYRIFCNRGDNILMEAYTYPGALEGARQLGLHIHGVPMDEEGPRADDLQHILSVWDPSRGPKPRLFYTIPSGQNPTGATQSLERRRKIYQIAEEHDLIIIEDDPYYFLRTGSRTEEADQNTRLPSYLSIDGSGRVVRIDSTSKILAPGLRVGWVTASAQIIDKFVGYQDVSTVAVAGPSQWMTWKLLDECWGHQGFLNWLDSLSLEYRVRRDILLDACDRYLPQQICSWVAPTYGMFLWISLDWQKHPRFQKSMVQEDPHSHIAEIETGIGSQALMEGVQTTPGSLFGCNRPPLKTLHFRMTFAAAAREDLEEGVKIFADVVKREF
ncbi:PLP-dependent transferase, partial [Aspergillus sclerotioniger CBS 115572]